VFASDEEALAAAEAAYQRYLDVSNAVARDGWADTAPLGQVARDSALESDLANAAVYHDKGYHQVGEITTDSVSLQSYSAAARREVKITIYACADVSHVDLVDQSGVSIVGSDRPDRQPLEVDVDDQDGQLKVSRSEAWSGDSFC
jgi:hypothetical protein